MAEHAEFLHPRFPHASHDPYHDTSSLIPAERAQQILAARLCGWITGHNAPEGHFLIDAEMILTAMHKAGVRFHLAGPTENATDGYATVSM